MDNKKQCVSVRLKPKDVEKIESLARRLGVRNSDIIRYAIKNTLTQLINLQNSHCRGHRLFPTLVEHAGSLTNHLDLDADRLDEIINEGLSKDEQIDRSDVELIALSGLSQHHIQPRLEELFGRQVEMDEMPQVLEDYLMDKYARANSNANEEIAPFKLKSHLLKQR